MPDTPIMVCSLLPTPQDRGPDPTWNLSPESLYVIGLDYLGVVQCTVYITPILLKSYPSMTTALAFGVSSLREPAPQRYRDTAWGWQPFLGLLLSPLEGPRPVLN